MPHATQPIGRTRSRQSSKIAVVALVLSLSAMTYAGYEVRPGDTLAGIATENGTTVSELAEANGITNPDLIRVGQTLSIPGGSADASHTVRAGESLAVIAAQYDTTVSELIAANGLANPNLIRIGQLLAIPESSTTDGVDPTSNQGQTILGSHIVAVGDTVASIARRYGTTVEAIAQANGLVNPSQIFAGTQLTIASGSSAPTPSAPTGTSVHTVTPGETLGSIASRFDTTVQSLLSANAIDDPNLIRPGDELTVPSAGWTCPVAGARYFNDWGFPRSGGRFHQGNDLYAPRGTAVKAPVSGTAELKTGIVGGLQVWLTGDDGRMYIGTHLDSFGSGGRVAGGTIVGYVGDSGNAIGSDPHLHFEILVGGSPVNPYPILQQSGC